MRHCPCCGLEKELSEFHKRSSNPDKYNSWCKSCKTSARRKRREHTPDCKVKAKQYYLKRWYGLTTEQYNNMYKSQKGLCKICSCEITISDIGKKGIKVHVDHCHSTGRVRGLLCTKCNTLLGMANDNITILANAIKYLDRSQDD